MPGLVPGIHDFLVSRCSKQDVDGRDISAFTRVFRRAMPGHDDAARGCQTLENQRCALALLARISASLRSQASACATIWSRLSNCGVQLSCARMRLASATIDAGSPGRRAESRTAKSRPLA